MMDEIKLLWESLNRNRKETDILIRDLNHRINILENDVDKLKEELEQSVISGKK